jgi:beta-xylosidase
VALARLRGEILVHDKNLLLLHHQGHYQLLLRNTVVYNPWLSSEAAFIQRFSQPYSVRLQGLDGRWRIKQHLFDQHHGALFPLVDAFRSRSGPDAEDYQWLMHQARPALSVDEAGSMATGCGSTRCRATRWCCTNFRRGSRPEVNREFSAGSPSLPD